MTAAPQVYKKALYIRAVIEAAEAAGIRLSALTVLYYLCKWSKSDGPVVDQSKPQISAACKIDLKTVKIALAKLRDAGALRAIARPNGGIIPGKRRLDGGVIGAAVVYRLEIIKAGEKIPPVSDGKPTEIRGRKFPQKGGENFQKRGEKTPPPNKNQYKSRETGEGAARGGGGFRPVLGVAVGNTHGAQEDKGREIDQDARAEYRRALLACDGNAYKALALVDQWRAERDTAAQAAVGL